MESSGKVFLSVPLIALLNDEEANSQHRTFYGRIAEICDKRNLNAYEPYFHGHPLEHDYIRPDEIYRANEQHISESRLLIAYVGKPSAGVSIEIEIANRYDIPVILLFEEEQADIVSRMVLGCPAAKDHIVDTDLDSLLNKLDEKLDGILERLAEERASALVQKRTLFLELLNKAHKDSGLSLSQVDRFSGVNKGYISRLLAGRIDEPGRDQIIKLCGWGGKLSRDTTNRILRAGGYPNLW